MSKYIVDIPDGVEWGVVTCRTEDGFYTRDFDFLEELNSDYINEHFGELQDEAYHAGLNDAWEAAKKLFSSMADSDIEKAFPIEWNNGGFKALMNLQPQEAIAKLKAYEDKQKDRIEVGDEVEWDGDCFIVTKIFQPRNMKEQCDGIDDDGSVYHDILMEDLKKTGKHYDIASILEAMRK